MWEIVVQWKGVGLGQLVWSHIMIYLEELCIATSLLTHCFWVVLKQEVVSCFGIYNDDHRYMHKGANEEPQLQEAVP